MHSPPTAVRATGEKEKKNKKVGKTDLTFLDRLNLVRFLAHDTTLTYSSDTRGGEWKGPCPFCGGTDRFHVQRQHWKWFCRRCSPRWHNAVDYVQRKHKVTFMAAIKMLQDWLVEEEAKVAVVADMSADTDSPDFFLFSSFSPVAASEPQASVAANLFESDISLPTPHEPQPPSLAWQTQTKQLLAAAQVDLRALITGMVGRDHLANRGINPVTTKVFGLGWLQGHGLPYGITIPIYQGNQLWAVKLRIFDRPNKYLYLPGSHLGALYLADQITYKPTILVCEGEFDALLLYQECGDLCDVVTPGSASTPIQPAWQYHFNHASHILICMDNDPVGHTASLHWRNFLGPRATIIHPTYKDPTADYQHGLNLRDWLLGYQWSIAA